MKKEWINPKCKKLDVKQTSALRLLFKCQEILRAC